MNKTIRVISYGLGAIGRGAAHLALEKPSLQLVGAVDLNPANGRDLGVPVTTTLPVGKADAVIHCTGSDFSQVFEQLAAIARAGMHCVTSCEEALFPALRHRELAAQLDRICQEQNVACVGTGVNPGFVMDTLPVLITAVSQRVRAVHVLRVVDAGTRREALQRKVGAGMSVDEFRALAKTGKIRHVGLSESVAFVADALGWPWDKVDETIEPKLAPNGRVAGVRQVARSGAITLELEMYVGAPNPRDEIHIDGEPPLHVVIQGGTAGDVATPAILVNMLSRLVEAKPGFHTMRTLALPRFVA